jgi:hypothetical protein
VMILPPGQHAEARRIVRWQFSRASRAFVPWMEQALMRINGWLSICVVREVGL